MAASPTWLRVLAEADGAMPPPTASIRLLQGGEDDDESRIEAAIVRPRPKPSDEPTVVVPREPLDQRRLADVLDTARDERKRPYQLRGFIGEGGMGEVHLARQRSTGREVAIKALRPHQARGRRLAAFQQECRITALIEHPHVPPVYDAGADFMVMKLLKGVSLEDRLRTVPGELAAHVEALLKVCDAVALAHSHGIAHRDLKGENIMVGRFGEVWLMDWGLAAAFAPGADGEWHGPPVRTARQLCVGTPICAPPEVAGGDLARAGLPIDVFLLGGLLYRVLCGEYPFMARTSEEAVERAARADFPPLLPRAPQAPFRLAQAAERAMAWDPAARGDLAGFAAELRAWLHGSGAVAEAHALLQRARERLAGAAAADPARDYGRYRDAIAACERALALCPELRAGHELLAQARAGFARAAEACGDRTLARLVGEGFTPP